MRSVWNPEPVRGPGPCVLVVDDDRRVVDLLNIALAAHGFRVMGAADGDEAIRMVAAKRPDLVVLDVRLPKKSGFEVCELLRRDPDDPDLPIIMVSAASEAEARLQGFARGADDYMSKPFSPKELIARMKRLLARATDARESRRRGREAELELVHAREDMKRAHLELGREQRLRQLGAAIARELHGAADEDDLAARALMAVRTHFGVNVAALLTPEGRCGAMVPFACRGDGVERFAGAEVRAGGELFSLLAGMRRPVRRSELERFPDLREELAPFVVSGVSILAPWVGDDGLEAVLVVGERLDGHDLSSLELDVLALLCDAAAAGLAHARDCHLLADGLLDALIARAGESDPDTNAEAAALMDRAAGRLLIPPRTRELLARSLELGEWAGTDEGRVALSRAAAADPTGRLTELARLSAGSGGMSRANGATVHERQAAALLGVALDYRAARRRGVDASRALAGAMTTAGEALDDTMRMTLLAAATASSAH